MVTRGFQKRACAVVLIKKVKNPIKLAREMLVRGGKDGSGGGDLSGGAGGAQGHCCLGGETVEKLAKDWGLEMVDESYFWTRKRWDEHKRGLHESEDERTLGQNKDVWPCSEDSYRFPVHSKTHEQREEKHRWPLFSEQDSGWDGQAYLPQGTVGCVALDQYGTICVATSTGGLTNKLSGRVCLYIRLTSYRTLLQDPLLCLRRVTDLKIMKIGDTPTIGAGFWAEEWNHQSSQKKTTRQPPQDLSPRLPVALSGLAHGLRNVLGDCIPDFSGYGELSSEQRPGLDEKLESMNTVRAVAMSGSSRPVLSPSMGLIELFA